MENKAREEAHRIIDMFSDGANLIFEDELIQCALIYVEGIVKEINDIEIRYYTDEYALQKIIHWQEVKQELNKML
jgi:hypothetical protein